MRFWGFGGERRILTEERMMADTNESGREKGKEGDRVEGQGKESEADGRGGTGKRIGK